MSEVKLYLGDCLDILPGLFGPFDMILADLPYGTTACRWDVVIPFKPLWEQYKRLIKRKGAVVLFGSQPFTSALVMSNVEWFKYCWYWRKARPGGWVVAKHRPLADIEELCCFSNGTTANGSSKNMEYNPQGIGMCHKEWKRPRNYASSSASPARKSHIPNRIITAENYPRQVLDYPAPANNLLHPTQKPVALLEYLIRTYTQTGETVLDNTMGSGSTGVACVNTGRSFVGIEKDAGHFEIAETRIEAAQAEIVQTRMNV